MSIEEKILNLPELVYDWADDRIEEAKNQGLIDTDLKAYVKALELRVSEQAEMITALVEQVNILTEYAATQAEPPRPYRDGN